MTRERCSAILKRLGTCNMIGSKIFWIVDNGLVLRSGEVLKMIIGGFWSSVIRSTRGQPERHFNFSHPDRLVCLYGSKISFCLDK